VPGAPGSVVVTLSDVSGRKKAESRTLASELKFEGLVQGSIQGIVVVRGERALFCNAAGVAILGFADAAQVVALPSLGERVHPDDREAVRAGYAEVVAGRGATQRVSFRALRRDGAVIWLEVFPSVVLWEGEPALQLTLHDVTERHQAARSLQESEERYRTLVEHAQVSIVVRRDGRPVFANNQALRDVGFETALYRAYARWVSSFCAQAPDRLKGVGVVSLQDAKGAAKELARLGELGMTGVMINGTAGAKRLDHPDHEPFFAEADRLRVPIAVHFSLQFPVVDSLFEHHFIILFRFFQVLIFFLKLGYFDIQLVVDL